MRAFILLALVSASLFACKKENRVAASDPIIGKWNLVLTTGGFGGIHQTPAQTGHTKSIEFRTNNTCTTTYDGNSGANNFYIKEEYSANLQQNVKMLYLSSEKFIVNYVQDTLTLEMDVIDGTTDWFVKQ